MMLCRNRVQLTIIVFVRLSARIPNSNSLKGTTMSIVIAAVLLATLFIAGVLFATVKAVGR